MKTTVRRQSHMQCTASSDKFNKLDSPHISVGKLHSLVVFGQKMVLIMGGKKKPIKPNRKPKQDRAGDLVWFLEVSSLVRFDF